MRLGFPLKNTCIWMDTSIAGRALNYRRDPVPLKLEIVPIRGLRGSEENPRKGYKMLKILDMNAGKKGVSLSPTQTSNKESSFGKDSHFISQNILPRLAHLVYH